MATSGGTVRQKDASLIMSLVILLWFSFSSSCRPARRVVLWYCVDWWRAQ